MDARNIIVNAIKEAEKKPLPDQPWFSIWNLKTNPFELKPKNFKTIEKFVNRKSELKLLTELMIFLARGFEGFFIIWGPDGVGKTSLLNVALEGVINTRSEASKAIRKRLDGQILDAAEILRVDESESNELDFELPTTYLSKAIEEYRENNKSFFILDNCSLAYEQINQLIAETRIIRGKFLILNSSSYHFLLKTNRQFIQSVKRIIKLAPFDSQEMEKILNNCLCNSSQYIQDKAIKKVISVSYGNPGLMLSILNRIGEFISQSARKIVTLNDVNLVLKNEYPYITADLTKTELNVLEIFQLIGSPISVLEIAENLTMDRTSASTHLSSLREKGFVKRNVIQRRAYFSLVSHAKYVIDSKIYDSIERENEL